VWASLPVPEYAFEAIKIPWLQLDPTESKILQQALWLRAGEPIYFTLGAEPPWIVGNYTPLYPFLCSLMISPSFPSFLWPRLITFVAADIAGIFLFAFVYRAMRSTALGLLAAGLWWSTYEVYWYASLCRIDMLAIAFGVAGLYSGLTSLHRWRWWRLLLTCALFWLAWLTRQTQILLPLALLIWLLVIDRRWAVRFAALWIGGLALIFAALLVLTGGAFWTTTVTYNINAWVFGQFLIWLRHLAFSMWPIGLLAGVFAAATLLVSRRRPSPEAEPERSPLQDALPLLSIALGLNALNVLATGKVGADKNYLLEPLWCLAGLLTLLFAALAQRVRTHRWSSVSLGLFAALLFLHVLWNAASPIPLQSLARHPTLVRELLDGPLLHRWLWRAPPQNSPPDFAIALAIMESDGPVLAEYGIYALRHGRELIHEPFLMSQLAEQGLWDEAPLLERIRAREFGVILTADDLASPGPHQSATQDFARAVRENYVEADQVFTHVHDSATLHLWRPKP
jgi:hypothetical protein